MKRISLNLLILSLMFPTPLLPFQVISNGVKLEAQDLTHIPLGNLFKPLEGDRQDMASIDVNKKLNLCMIGISIKNESTISYVLDPKVINPYTHREYNKLLNYLASQDKQLYMFRLKSLIGLLAVPFVSATGVVGAMGIATDKPIVASLAAIPGIVALLAAASGSYYGAKAASRQNTLIRDRKNWINIYGIDYDPLVIRPGQTVKKVILFDRNIYKSKDFILSLAQVNNSKGQIASFCIPLNSDYTQQ